MCPEPSWIPTGQVRNCQQGQGSAVLLQLVFQLNVCSTVVLSICQNIGTAKVAPAPFPLWPPSPNLSGNGLLVFGSSLPLTRAEAASLARSVHSWQWSRSRSSCVTRAASHKWLAQQEKPRRGPSLPCERVDFQGELLEQGGFGGVGQDQDDVHMPWPQAHQVTGVVDVR